MVPPKNPRQVMLIWSSPKTIVLLALLVRFRDKGLGVPAAWFRVKGLRFEYLWSTLHFDPRQEFSASIHAKK